MPVVVRPFGRIRTVEFAWSTVLLRFPIWRFTLGAMVRSIVRLGRTSFRVLVVVCVNMFALPLWNGSRNVNVGIFVTRVRKNVSLEGGGKRFFGCRRLALQTFSRKSPKSPRIKSRTWRGTWTPCPKNGRWRGRRRNKCLWRS